LSERRGGLGRKVLYTLTRGGGLQITRDYQDPPEQNYKTVYKAKGWKMQQFRLSAPPRAKEIVFDILKRRKGIKLHFCVESRGPRRFIRLKY
jgi:hypothetical protein